jgi:hypothetical protein
VVIDKRAKEILIVEIGVTSIDNLQQVESEKLRKYDLLANELGLIHGCKIKIIPYVLTWDGIVTKYHEKYRKELEVTDLIEAYIQSATLMKTLESISLKYRRGGDMRIPEDEMDEHPPQALFSLIRKRRYKLQNNTCPSIKLLSVSDKLNCYCIN